MSAPVAILAGGEGRRIGGGKPLRLLGGQTLLGRSIAQARQWSDCIAVVVRSPEQAGEADVALIADRPGIDGPLAGVAAALEWARAAHSAAVLTIPADMPFLPADLCSRLERRRPDGQVALASSDGRTHPVCALWPVGALAELQSFLRLGRASLQGFAQAVGCATAEWPCEPFDPFFNVNRPEDLEQAERILNA